MSEKLEQLEGLTLLLLAWAFVALMAILGSGCGKAYADVRLMDEGADAGIIGTLNCVGAGVSCSRSRSTGSLVIEAGGGGETHWKSVDGGIGFDGGVVRIGVDYPSSTPYFADDALHVEGAGGVSFTTDMVHIGAPTSALGHLYFSPGLGSSATKEFALYFTDGYHGDDELRMTPASDAFWFQDAPLATDESRHPKVLIGFPAASTSTSSLLGGGLAVQSELGVGTAAPAEALHVASTGNLRWDGAGLHRQGTSNGSNSVALNSFPLSGSNTNRLVQLATDSDDGNSSRLAVGLIGATGWITTDFTGALIHSSKNGTGTTRDLYLGAHDGITAASMALKIPANTVVVQPRKIQIPRLALDTCSAANEGLEQIDILSGASTGNRTRKCLCTSSGAASYAWQNEVSGTLGTATTCPN
jgi:hypothetical protein